jgi:hypothetical protein
VTVPRLKEWLSLYWRRWHLVKRLIEIFHDGRGESKDRSNTTRTQGFENDNEVFAPFAGTLEGGSSEA